MALFRTASSTPRWALLVLCAALCLLLAPASSQATPRTPANKRPPARRSADKPLPDWADVVYLADARRPKDAAAAGGFLAPLKTPPQSAEAFSLYLHARAEAEGRADDRESAYLSATRDYMLAAKAAAARESGGWVYFVYPSPNMFSVADSLGAQTPKGSGDEVAAVGGIHWSQVLAYIYIGHGGRIPTPEELQDPVKDGFRNTENFDKRWFDFGLAKAQPQLAGNCGVVDDKASCETETREHVEGFMNFQHPIVGWRGYWPLFEADEAREGIQARAVRCGSTNPCPEGDSGARSRKPYLSAAPDRPVV